MGVDLVTDSVGGFLVPRAFVAERFKPLEVRFHIQSVNHLTPRAQKCKVVYMNEGGAHETVELDPESIDTSAAQRKARIRAGMMEAFAEGVRRCLSNPPDTWRVRKAADRVWQIVDAEGGDRGGRYATKRLALAALASGRPQRKWRDRVDWYLGQSSDPRTRELAADERAIVSQVVSELDLIEWSDQDNVRYCIEVTRAGRLEVHLFGADSYDLWGYDAAGKYSGPHDRAPFQCSPFHTEHDDEVSA